MGDLRTRLGFVKKGCWMLETKKGWIKAWAIKDPKSLGLVSTQGCNESLSYVRNGVWKNSKYSAYIQSDGALRVFAKVVSKAPNCKNPKEMFTMKVTAEEREGINDARKLNKAEKVADSAVEAADEF